MKPSLLLFLAVQLIIVNSCKENHGAELDTKGNFVPEGKETSTTVKIKKVNYQTFHYLISTTGKIKSQKEYQFTAALSGTLIKCVVAPGLGVSAGSMVAQFDPVPSQNKIEKGNIARYNAEKEYESLLLGYENLLKGKTKEEEAAIKKKLYISSGLAQAGQDIQEAEYELTKTAVKAPFNGILANIKVQKGQIVTAGQELFSIYDPANLLLEVMIMESDIAFIQSKLQAEITPINNPGTTYNAHPVEINPYVDENGMVQVKFKILNPRPGKALLFPGMNCTITIRVPVNNALVVPKEAVVMRGDKPVVFTLEKGKAKWNYVTTGRDNGKELEIKEGIKQGDKVIVSNNMQLVHDAAVSETSDSSLSNQK
jgi:membrane fusion protein (multidrug efflux system)